MISFPIQEKWNILLRSGDRVVRAREIQAKRFESFKGVYSNSQMSSSMQRKYCQLDESGGRLLKTAMDIRGLSARAYDRILKVARTIADLGGSDNITQNISLKQLTTVILTGRGGQARVLLRSSTVSTFISKLSRSIMTSSLITAKRRLHLKYRKES